MRLNPKTRPFAAVALVTALSSLPLTSSTSAGPTDAALVPAVAPTAELLEAFAGGRAGFIVSDIKFAIGGDAEKTGACPNGMSTTARAAYMATPEGRQREGEADADYRRRLSAAIGGGFGGGPGGGRAPGNVCESPQSNPPDPYFRTVSGPNIRTDGIDMDGRNTHGKKAGSSGGCAHDDFVGMNGERGIDNQFYRAIGCVPGFQTSGSKNGFGTEMLTGAWGILISLSGVDNPLNDDDVEVGIYASADPIQLSAARNPLRFASYGPDRDARYRATTRGRIVNGILTTEPVNVRFHSVTNNMWMDRSLDAARLRLTIMKDGSMDGYLAGYANVDELYDVIVGYRNGKTDKGQPAPQRVGSAFGSAASAGTSCNGMYHALHQMADGNRDPKTGKCTTISTQYRIKALPSFIVNEPKPQLNQTASSK